MSFFVLLFLFSDLSAERIEKQGRGIYIHIYIYRCINSALICAPALHQFYIKSVERSLILLMESRTGGRTWHSQCQLHGFASCQCSQYFSKQRNGLKIGHQKSINDLINRGPLPPTAVHPSLLMSSDFHWTWLGIAQRTLLKVACT